MFKKAVAVLLAASMAMSLAACGGSGAAETTQAAGSEEATTAEAAGETTAEAAEGESAAEEAASGDQVTIRMSWWGGDSRHEQTLAAVDAFMKKYPNIKVETEYGASKSAI